MTILMRKGGVASKNEERNDIEVREFYNNFTPPRYARRLVVRLLSSVPAKYSRGIESVVLTNQSGAPRRQRLGKVTSRKRRLRQHGVLGRYYRASSGKPAWIELYVDNLAKAASYHPFLPMGRTACFGQVLFHEIGHHVHATARPEFREKEDVAGDWGKRLLRNYLLVHYWFVPRPVWKAIGWALKAIAAEL